MDLIRSALRKPISVMVALIAVAFFSVITLRVMPIDIFPKMGVPTIYVAQPYGGLSPEQMEGYLSSVFEQHFIYITGIKKMESRSIQSMSLIKLEFHEDTNMAESMAQIVAQVNRASGKMPPGTIAPFVVRYDAGNVPVGQLVFSSETRPLSEIQDLAVKRVRPMFSSLQGVSSPPPVGGNQRSIVIDVDPIKLKSYGLSTEDVVEAIALGNILTPSGSVRIDDKEFLTKPNSVVKDYTELGNIPIHLGSGASVYVKDLAEVKNSADITTGYAHVNNQRSVYIPVTKRSNASTWSVVKSIKNELPKMQDAVPEDIEVSFAFDQSGYVIKSLRNVLSEGIIAALLTGLMVFLFLGDWRSSLVVILNIPIAILIALIALFLAGETINIMTLVGLALSIGVLVDEATVTIENIHAHLDKGKSLPKAIFDGTKEIVSAKILIVLSILAVFVPSFFMSGVPKSMFVPLSLAVGFAMIASFILSQTFVPVVANWLIKKDKIESSRPLIQPFLDKVFKWYEQYLQKTLQRTKSISLPYALIGIGLSVLLFVNSGYELFPKVDAGQFQMRISAPDGTRIEVTERIIQSLHKDVEEILGEGELAISSGYIGTVPSAYPAATTYIWNNGPHVANLKMKLKDRSSLQVESIKEQIRTHVKENYPELKISFEPADIVDQVMSMGADNPIQISVSGKDNQQIIKYAKAIRNELQKIESLRDVQIDQPIDYPTLAVDIDRIRAGQVGLTTSQVSKSLISATNSSRFTRPIFWLEESSGNAYQIQVEIPQYTMNSEEALGNVFLPKVNQANPRLQDVAEISETRSMGEVFRINQQKSISISANLHNESLGKVLSKIDKAIGNAGEKPRGVKVFKGGQLEVINETLGELQIGLLIAIMVVFLMLSLNFQSFAVAFSTLSTIPAIVVGSLLFLGIFGQTLNIQSYMGMIMALGVAIANAILFTTFAEQARKLGKDAITASKEAGMARIRPILMTSFSMIIGLIPLALGGDQTAALGIAVIGGLLFATFTTLLVMPCIYGWVMNNKTAASLSLDPYDKESTLYEATEEDKNK